MVYILFLGEEPVQKKRRIEQSFWANIRSAKEKSENDDDKSDEHDDKLSSTSLLVFPDVIPHHDIINQLSMLIKATRLHPGVPQSVNADVVAKVVLGSMTVVVSVLVAVV